MRLLKVGWWAEGRYFPCFFLHVLDFSGDLVTFSYLMYSIVFVFFRRFQSTGVGIDDYFAVYNMFEKQACKRFPGVFYPHTSWRQKNTEVMSCPKIHGFSVQHRWKNAWNSGVLEALGNTFPAFLSNVNYLHNHLERQHPQALLLKQTKIWDRVGQALRIWIWWFQAKKYLGLWAKGFSIPLSQRWGYSVQRWIECELMCSWWLNARLLSSNTLKLDS